MKLIGIIAFLVLVSVGCQKEDISPNSCNNSSQLRGADAGGVDEDTDVIDDGTGTSGPNITDPNDENRSGRASKPRPQ